MALVSRVSLVSLVSPSLAQMKMKAPDVYVYASQAQSLMKDTVLERELWGLWVVAFGLREAFAGVQVQNQI